MALVCHLLNITITLTITVPLPSITDIPRAVRQMDTAHKSAMGCSWPSSVIVFAEGVLMPRMVYCYVRSRNLSFEFVYSIFNTENRSGLRFRW